jgi:hypothetical protein
MTLTTRSALPVARTAVVAAAMGFTALTLAPSADAAILDRHLAVDCPQPFSQTCAPR